MSRFVEVSPLPQGTTEAQVRKVFSAFFLHRVAVKDAKAYLEFDDAGDLETLDFTFIDAKVDALGGAEISPLPEDFQFPETEQPKKVAHSEETNFILPQNNQKIESLPGIIVVKQCDEDAVLNISREDIKSSIFGLYQVTRVEKWKRDVYVEFADRGQLELLDQNFQDLKVPDLGSQAYIDQVDENFNFDSIADVIAKHDADRHEKKQAEQRSKHVELEKRAAQMEEIRRKKEEEERKEKIALEEIERRRREEEEKEKTRKEEEQRKIDELLKRKSQETVTEGEIRTVRPEGERMSREENKEDNSKTSTKALVIFWAVAIVSWGIYVIFV